MKNLSNTITIVIWSIITLFCTSCETTDIDDRTNGGVLKDKTLHLCSNWGASKERVKQEMQGYNLDKETDNILYFSANNASYIVTYEFQDEELCTALAMVEESAISDSSMLQFVSGYTEVGFVDSKMVYLNEDKNTIATYSTETDSNVKRKTLGLSQLDIGGPRNLFCYTTTDNHIVTPFKSDPFNVKIKSNTYKNGVGVIECDGDITTIKSGAFLSCTSLTSLTIPDSVTSIEGSAFAGCSSLSNITIPNNVTSIGSSAFRDCTSLTSVTIPNSVTSIGNTAFYRCTSLKAFYGKFATEDNRCLIVEGSLNSFAIGCKETEYIIPDNVTSIEFGAFCSCTSLTSVTIPDSVTKIGDSAFWGCTSLTSVTIPDSVTSIESCAFWCCESLTSITIPDGVTSIEDRAFWCCESLTSITIPDSVTSIGREAFDGCTSLTSATIGNSVTSIGESAFYNCKSLTSVTIPDSVTSIGNGAFYKSTSLSEVYCKPLAPPTPLLFNEYLGWSAFDDNASGRKIYVPRESVEAYKSASYWRNYASDIVGYDF